MYTKIHTSQAQLKTIRNFQEIKQLRSRSKLNLVCNYIIHKCIFFDENGRIYFESEETIAKIMGCSIATVIRAVRILRNSGIIQRIRRFNGKKTLSNIYKLRPHMRMDSIIEELAPYLPALRNILCLSILIPVMTWLKPAIEKHRPENDRLYYKTKYLKILDTMNVNGYSTKNGAKRMEHHQPPIPKQQTASKTKESEDLQQGYDNNPSKKSHTYGGTGLYDCKISQFEIDLQAKVRERQRKKYQMMSDPEAQPRYNDPQIPTTRYSSLIDEDPQVASAKLLAWTKTQDFEKFSALFGRETALKMCRNILNSALENKLEKPQV